MIGFGAREIGAWEPYQVMAVYRGYVSANTEHKAKPPTDEQFEAAVARTVH